MGRNKGHKKNKGGPGGGADNSSALVRLKLTGLSVSLKNEENFRLIKRLMTAGDVKIHRNISVSCKSAEEAKRLIDELQKYNEVNTKFRIFSPHVPYIGENIIFAAKLPRTTNKALLMDTFKKAIDCEVYQIRRGRSLTGVAKIIFNNEEDAQEALSFKDLMIHGKRIKLSKHALNADNPGEGSSGTLPQLDSEVGETSEQDVNEYGSEDCENEEDCEDDYENF